jgi:hypothetical protein
MASVKDIERVPDDLERLVGELRSEIRKGPDFSRLVEIVDEIGQHADDAATTFNSIDETLMSRLNQIGQKGQGSRSRSDGSSRQSASTS